MGKLEAEIEKTKMQRGEQTRDDEEWMFVRKLFSRMIFSVFISLSSEHSRPVQSETFRQLPTPSNLLAALY